MKCKKTHGMNNITKKAQNFSGQNNIYTKISS